MSYRNAATTVVCCINENAGRWPTDLLGGHLVKAHSLRGTISVKWFVGTIVVIVLTRVTEMAFKMTIVIL